MYHPHIELVRKSYYKHIWNTCYNLSTKSPRVDKCDVCHNLETEIGQLKAAGRDSTDLQTQWNEHKAKANVAYQHLKDAKDNKIWISEEWIVICMDLQKTFLIPQTNYGSHYYYRKVNVYNFCITEVLTGTPHFYIWTEYDGGKGSAEIYSCIYKWLQQNEFNRRQRRMKLRIIADNCGK